MALSAPGSCHRNPSVPAGPCHWASGDAPPASSEPGAARTIRDSRDALTTWGSPATWAAYSRGTVTAALPRRAPRESNERGSPVPRTRGDATVVLAREVGD